VKSLLKHGAFIAIENGNKNQSKKAFLNAVSLNTGESEEADMFGSLNPFSPLKE
jgi:hypothetical protein